MIHILRELRRNKTGRSEGASMADLPRMIRLEKMTAGCFLKSNGKSGTFTAARQERKNGSR